MGGFCFQYQNVVHGYFGSDYSLALILSRTGDYTAFELLAWEECLFMLQFYGAYRKFLGGLLIIIGQ